jgi:type I restriction enzyme S subunit
VLNGSTPSSSDPLFWDGDINWFTPDDLGDNNAKFISESRRKITIEGYESCGVKIAPTNSIAISTRAPIGHLAIIEREACVNQGCRLLVPKGVDSSFYYYVFSSAKELLQVLGQGSTFTELSRQKLNDFRLPFPEIEQQRSIASFLDYKTAQIDNLIEKKEQLLKLLEEKRIALITNAVTGHIPLLRGEEGVCYKDSSIPYLGKIPNHWQVKSLKRIVTTPITDGPHETPELFDDGILFISAEAIKNEVIDFSRKRGFISPEDHARFSKKYFPQRNDIYVIKSGATTGNVAMVETEEVFNIWSPLAAIRTNLAEAMPKYIFYYLKSECFKTSIILGWSFGTQQNIGMDVIENLTVTLPPINEQKIIVAYLDKELSRLDKLSSKISEAIEKLKEYRTALITAAVTGKIDVRNFKPNLPLLSGEGWGEGL